MLTWCTKKVERMVFVALQARAKTILPSQLISQTFQNTNVAN
jgi:hypothetical protein